MNKLFFTLSILLVSMEWGLAQTFKPVSEEVKKISGTTSYSLKSLVDAPKKYTRLEIDIKDCEQTSKFDASRFENLQVVEIRMAEDPAAPDEMKKDRVRIAQKNLEVITQFKNAPQLKYIVFAIGEGLFLTEDEDISSDREEEINLLRAYKSLGESLEKMMPQTKIVAYEWNW